MSPKLPSLRKLPSAPAPGIQAAGSAFKQLIAAYSQYKNVHEVESTKREYIRANRDVALARIKSQRDLLESYLTKTFQERSKVIEGFFKTLDQGIASGDDRIIGMAMQSIIATVQTSPLQGINEYMKQFDDPDVKSIEI